jgi:transglutaminase-like putative cysteine protease
MKMAGDEVGWVYVKTVRFYEYGSELFRTDTRMHMEMRRLGGSVEISGEGWTLENAKGHIIKAHMKTMMSEVETLQDLVVENGKAMLTVTTMGTPHESSISWADEVIGPMGTWMLRKKKGLQEGTSYSFKTYTPDFNKVITVTVKNGNHQKTELLDGEEAMLYQSVSTSDIMPGLKTYEWVDEKYETVKTSTDMMGITIESYRTTEERAKKAGGAEIKADMIIETMARSNVNLPNPYRLDSILYRIEAKDPELGLPKHLDTFCQNVLESDGQTATVLITARTPDRSQKRPMTDPPPELHEYLESNAYCQSDHPGLKAKALEVVGNETDAWKAAVKLEHFVREYIADKNMGTGFASAAEVFENPSGDCSEHGVFLTALCRAAGIPSRVAVGYMYLGGIFGGHMWVEVWIHGEWYPIDGVTGLGRVDPTHLKFMDSSFKEGGIGEAFASVVTAIGNLDITILEFTRGDKKVKVGEEFNDYVIEGDLYSNTLYGISIRKPEGYDFDNFERDYSGISFTLVELEGESDGELKAYPLSFSASLDEYIREMVARRDAKILSSIPRKISGRKCLVYMIEDDDETYRVLAIGEEDTCFLLRMRIEDEERDLAAFEGMARSIRFMKK